MVALKTPPFINFTFSSKLKFRRGLFKYSFYRYKGEHNNKLIKLLKTQPAVPSLDLIPPVISLLASNPAAGGTTTLRGTEF